MEPQAQRCQAIGATRTEPIISEYMFRRSRKPGGSPVVGLLGGSSLDAIASAPLWVSAPESPIRCAAAAGCLATNPQAFDRDALHAAGAGGPLSRRVVYVGNRDRGDRRLRIRPPRSSRRARRSSTRHVQAPGSLLARVAGAAPAAMISFLKFGLHENRKSWLDDS